MKFKVHEISWDKWAEDSWWRKYERKLIDYVLTLPEQTKADIIKFLEKYEDARITLMHDGFDDTEAIDVEFYWEDQQKTRLTVNFYSPPFGDDLGLNVTLRVIR